MKIRLPTTIGVQMAVTLFALGFVALGGAATTWIGMTRQADRIEAMTRASDGPELVERLRAGVNGVVMESRGLYLAANRGQSESFAAKLREHLARVEADWRELAQILPPEDRAQTASLDAAMSVFVQMRTELARVGVAEGREAADKLGNNAANRSTREAFSRSLDELAQTTRANVARLKAETLESGRQLAIVLAAGTAVAVAGVLAMALWLTRRTIARPLHDMANALREMAAGRLDNVCLPPGGLGEVGEIAAAAGVFLEKLHANRELEAALAGQRAARDKRQAAMDRNTIDFGDSISGVMASLGRTAGTMRGTANEIAAAVGKTLESAHATAAGAGQSARDLVAVAAATEELTASVDEIARQVAAAAGLAREAVAQAELTDTRVHGLSETAAQIAEVSRAISDIAGQTNLLALNATIEAARAGEAGKGFAVVASEVKALAAQTARATSRIGGQIAAIQTATDEAVAAVRDVGAAIGHMNQVASAIAAAVEQQSVTTRDIAAAVQDVTRRTQAASEAMNDVAGIADAARASSDTLLTVSDHVSQVAGALHAEVDQFLDSLRDEAADRRKYERIPGGGKAAILHYAGTKIAATVQDIGLGGVALLCAAALESGAPIQVELPGAATPLAGRVARVRNGVAGITFARDPATIALAERVFDTIAADSARAKAA